MVPHLCNDRAARAVTAALYPSFWPEDQVPTGCCCDMRKVKARRISASSCPVQSTSVVSFTPREIAGVKHSHEASSVGHVSRTLARTANGESAGLGCPDLDNSC